MDRKLYFGGTILTMDPAIPKAEAVLTENGKIRMVGRYQDLKAYAAEPVDLQGKTMMPGFVDGHSHMINVGMNITKYCDLDGCRSFEEILERIRSFVKNKDLKPGQGITCRGYDLAILKEGKHPTAALLDSLELDYPIACVHQSGHMSVYNTIAMRKAGVFEDTYTCPPGGFVGRDENGKLSGYFEETATGAFSSVFASTTPEEDIVNAVLAAQDYYIQHGYTTIQEGSANAAMRIDCLERLAEEGNLKVDVVAYLGAAPKQSQGWEDLLTRYGRSYRNRLKIGGVKIFLDGSPQARTAWMKEPYEGETEYRGYPTLTDAQVEERLSKALDFALQPMAHCNGDAASEQFLSAWEKVTADKGTGFQLRPVMIHAQTVGYDQLDRMAKVGMMASFFVGHCYYWGDTHLHNLGQRGMRISPVRTAQKKNVVFSFHQDSPVTKPDMLHTVWCAVNRLTRSGVCVGEENRISCYDALIAATNGGAYTYFEEDTKGILKAGAVADFVILDQDPTAVDPLTIKDIKVLRTIKEDQVIYQAE